MAIVMSRLRLRCVPRCLVAAMWLLAAAAPPVLADSGPPPMPLRIYAWTGYVDPYLADADQQLRKQGIRLNFERTHATGLEGFQQQLRQRSADLVSPSHDLVPQLQAEGLLQPLPDDCVPNRRLVNPLFRRKLPEAISRYVVPFTFGPYTLAYNTAVMPEPHSYRVLWDSRYRGRITISRYDTANIYMVALMLGYGSEQLFNLSDAQLQQITAELKTLRSTQQPVYWETNLDPALADRIDVGVDWSVGVRLINQQGKQRWKMVIPREGATAWVDVWAIGAHVSGEKLRAACAFINASLDARAQAKVASATGYGVVNSYATRYLSAADIVEFHITDADYLARMILWQPLPPEVLARYQKAWRDSEPSP